MAPQDALIVRQEALPDHAVVPYTGEDLARQRLGPANPFRDDSSQNATALKRKNVLTGFAEETFISEHTFRSKHRAVERAGGPEREFISGAQAKAEAAATRARREGKGNATIADGDGAYVGPWAKYKRPAYEEVEVEDEAELDSDEEYEIVEEEDEDDVVESGTVVSAPAEALARRKQVEEMGGETTTFHGSEEFDYQGRTYMHVPQDLDIDLHKDVGSVTNFIPKKLVHTWRNHTKAVTSLRFFPGAGHLLLSGSADTTIKIWDVYHQRELLRTYSGHNKAISDLTYNLGGTKFLSGSYDRMMKLWDTETGVCISKFTTGKTPHCLQFNPSVEHSNEFLAGMSDKKIVQFDIRAGNDPVQEYDHHLAAINTITFVDENRRFMTTSDDKSVRAWDYNIPVPIKYIAEIDMFPLTRAAAHPSGKYVAYQSSNNEIVVYNSNDKFRQNRKKSYRGHNNAGTAIDIDISPDGQFLASGDSGGYVCFWDWKTCKMYHKIRASDQAVTCVQWSPQETSKVVTAGMDGDIKFWD
ncbi:putative pre-mrna-processing factor 17 protein [Phaeoacremonium minimum UCRPA7]|uniref:Putative pre-mrna-processing factor 17 protein n=1 Tax=Phaeoacremonium minimum (strain UCR-PA7) TaxID=1286976 RepID=R8BCS2_PHAM7|nr:putative pre-mrna-processing factor 17 protein [Phaeoacremonium minimum UCRPA7]EON97090.1 putative pre-mrna-processing factor 17 protein [Phaeoacremonium minimum UCRPA7]